MSFPDTVAESHPDDPNLDRKLAGIVAGIVGGFSAMAAASGGGIENVGGAVTWHSPSNIPVFNAAGLFSPELISPSTLGEIGAYFRDQSRPYAVMILDGVVRDAGQSLVDMGYIQVDSMSAMWLDSLGDVPRDYDKAVVEVRRAETSMERATFRSVLIQVFGMPAREVEIICSDRSFDMPNVRHYIARTQEVIAGTATLVTGGETAGIWNVGTLSQHRRQGIALQMMHQAHTEAIESGCLSSMLLASPDGTPLYERLGYSTLSTLRVFIPTGEHPYEHP